MIKYLITNIASKDKKWHNVNIRTVDKCWRGEFEKAYEKQKNNEKNEKETADILYEDFSV